jgi:hypothetical protein
VIYASTAHETSGELSVTNQLFACTAGGCAAHLSSAGNDEALQRDHPPCRQILRTTAVTAGPDCGCKSILG